MRNSVVVIFGLAAVLFVADSDSAAARFVSEKASGAEDAVSELADALFDGGLNLNSPIAGEESLPNHQRRLHKRDSRAFFRQSGPEIDVSGLAIALKQLEAQLAEISNQVAASIVPYDPQSPLPPTRSYQRPRKVPTGNIAVNIAGMAYDTILALAKQLQNLQKPASDDDPTQVRQSGAVPLPILGPGESGYTRSEILLPINTENLPFNPIPLPFNPISVTLNPSTLPFDPASIPMDPVTLPLDPVALPFDPEGAPSMKPKPILSTKPNSDPPKISNDEPSNKPNSLEEDPDSPEEGTDLLHNRPPRTRVVYENRVNDSPFNLIPAVLHLRVRKQ